MWKPEFEFDKVTRPLLCSVVAPVVGSTFVYGYSLGVVNVPQKMVGLWLRRARCLREGGLPDRTTNETQHSLHDKWCRKLNEEDEETMFKENSDLNILWVLVTALFCIGGVFGAMVTSRTVQHFGRKGAILVNNVFGVLGAGLQFGAFFVESFEMFLVGRFFMGLHSGIASTVPPMYYTEVAPTPLRGAFGCLHQLFISVGILTSQVLGLPSVLGSVDLLPYLFGFTILPCILQLVLAPTFPESPKALFIVRGDPEKAKRILVHLRQDSNIVLEVEEMKQEREEMQGHSRYTVFDVLKDPFLRSITIVAVVVMSSQQLSGINAVNFYSTSIFTSAGLVGTSALYATVGMGIAQLITTVGATIFVDKAGRKTLLLVGYAGMLLVTTLLFVFLLLHRYGNPDSSTDKTLRFSGHSDNAYPWAAYASMVCVFLFVVMFSVGPGPVPGFVVTEMFTQGPRAAANSWSVSASRFSNLLVAVIFPLLQAAVGEYVFVVFMVLLALIILYTFWKVPETKGKEIETIHAELEKRS